MNINKDYAYCISSSPYGLSENLINPKIYENKHGSVPAVGINEDIFVTGYVQTISETVELIKNAKFVFIFGELDRASFFEMGIAKSLNKDIYIVSLNENLNVSDLQLFYDDFALKQISVERLFELFD